MSISFKLYADEAMNTEAGGAYAGGRKQDVDFTAQGQTRDFVFYFGSKTPNRKLQTAAGPGSNQITITPIDILPNREANAVYELGSLFEPGTPNGYVYQVITAGTTAAAAPSYPVAVGSEVLDGTAKLRNIGSKHKPDAVKLALSSAGLGSAVGGSALPIGHTINSGAAIAVYVRLNNAVADIYDATGTPILALSLNEVVETAV
ncbi:hypothetical protein [Neisseria shayeganii]|uniref:Uncharacterized protein n=1 Tax=Neisseria shayeganii 871 TaxID=1032488 RepID=G4CGA3_9NEIS|nr:hypothetical protein [Neisseria shayeganii]EGY53151.1 hypothetical protein HMPREF9371_0642 [Neisseria shayeganii 871]